jgi:hypothetical protein
MPMTIVAFGASRSWPEQRVITSHACQPASVSGSCST